MQAGQNEQPVFVFVNKMPIKSDFPRLCQRSLLLCFLLPGLLTACSSPYSRLHYQSDCSAAFAQQAINWSFINQVHGAKRKWLIDPSGIQTQDEAIRVASTLATLFLLDSYAIKPEPVSGYYAASAYRTLFTAKGAATPFRAGPFPGGDTKMQRSGFSRAYDWQFVSPNALHVSLDFFDKDAQQIHTDRIILLGKDSLWQFDGYADTGRTTRPYQARSTYCSL